MASLKEIWKQLINDLNDDSAITDVIGTDNIHRSNPSQALNYPTLILDVTNVVVAELSGIGLYRPTPTFNVYATDPDQADDIFRALEAGWDIPHKRPQGVSTSNYAITQMRFLQLIEVGKARVVATSEVVTHFAIPTQMRIISLRD